MQRSEMASFISNGHNIYRLINSMHLCNTEHMVYSHRRQLERLAQHFSGYILNVKVKYMLVSETIQMGTNIASETKTIN